MQLVVPVNVPRSSDAIDFHKRGMLLFLDTPYSIHAHDFEIIIIIFMSNFILPKYLNFNLLLKLNYYFSIFKVKIYFLFS